MLKCVLVVVLLVGLSAVLNTADDFSGTELVFSYITWRHGDRTPISRELAVYLTRPDYFSTYSPFGLGQLTENGTVRGYSIGAFLRSRYNGFLSDNYKADEINIRASSESRTQATATQVLRALYNTEDSIPITVDNEDSDVLQPFSTCQKIILLCIEALTSVDALEISAKYAESFMLYSLLAGVPQLSPLNAMLLKGAIDGQMNYGIEQPAWVVNEYDTLQKIENESWSIYTLNTNMVRLSAGSLLCDFFKMTSKKIANEAVTPSKIYGNSAHDTIVSALLAATVNGGSPATFRPSYGATLSFELRRNIDSGAYGVAVLYAPNGGGDGLVEILKIKGCGDQPLCDYNKFVTLMADFVACDYEEACSIL